MLVSCSSASEHAPHTAVTPVSRLATATVCLQDHGVEYKGDDSPLTKADTESNRIICAGLQALTPHVPIISEETKTMPYSIRQVGWAHSSRHSSWDACAGLHAGPLGLCPCPCGTQHQQSMD